MYLLTLFRLRGSEPLSTIPWFEAQWRRSAFVSDAEQHQHKFRGGG